MKKIKMVLLLATLLILLVGIASAADASTDATSTSSNTPETKIIEDTQQVSHTNTQTVENNINKIETNTKTDNNITKTKTIQKDTKNNLKKDTTVDSWTALKNTINGAGADTTITLTENLKTEDTISFESQITITIDGKGYTIDGNQKLVFKINSGSSMILKNITIINAENEGGNGGAIDNAGNLSIINSTLTQNAVKGNSRDGCGGAIYNTGTLNITGSNFTHNTASAEGTGDGCGGAIYNTGTLNINNSNITHNNADFGGAIDSHYATNTISNTLFYDNARANFIINQDNHIELISTDNYISVSNFTIIVDDTVIDTGTGIGDFNNIIVPMGDNIKLIFNGTNMTNNTYILRSNTRDVSDYPALIAAIEEAKQNQYNKFIINLQPGGDYKATDNILYENSLTKDITINGNGVTLDGLNTYQFIQIATGHNLTLENITITNYTATRGGAIYSTGTLSIINSTLTNNTEMGTDRNDGGGAIYNGGGTLSIINSNFTNNTVTGQEYGCGGAIYNTGTLSINNSNLNNNTVTELKYFGVGCGGAIYNNGGTISINNSNFTDNTATGPENSGDGGAIYNCNGGTLSITDSNFNNNTATGRSNGLGGAIYNNATLTITNTNFTHNTATGRSNGGGGAIYNYNGGYLNINNSNLNNNNVTGQSWSVDGGAICNYGAVSINNSNLSQNTVTGQYYGCGGVIYNSHEATLIINNSNLNNNTVTGQESGYGGAIYNVAGTLTITDSNLTHNTVTGQEYSAMGGAIYANAGTLTITNSNLIYNTLTGENAFLSGGAIHNDGSSTLTITNSNITDNTATGQKNVRGGAIYNYYTLIINNSNLNNNAATGKNVTGGAIYNNYDGNITITNSNLTDNTATGQEYGYGGAIYNNDDGTLNITDSKITQNTATGQNDGFGGAIYNSGEINTISNTTFYYNTPLNFIINQDNHIELIINDSYISIGTFIIKEDEKEVYNSDMGALSDYTISSDNINLKLILNGTDTNTTNNVFILRKIKEVNITKYDELVNAIKDAQEEQYDKYIINLQQEEYIANQNITWSNSATRNIIINGNGNILNGQNTYQFIYIAREHNLTLENITITNYTAANGGAIDNNGNLSIINSTLTNNTVTISGRGGAIYNNGNLSIINSTLTNNTATGQNTGRGGAIYNIAGTLNINNSNLTRNTATGQDGYGGAIYNSVSVLNINNSNFTDNTATGQENGFGGAILNTRGNLNINNSNLTNNTATGQDGYGGAIYNNDDGNLNITNSNFLQNTATKEGGAIYNEQANAFIEANTFITNTAGASGSAIKDDSGSATIHDNVNADTSTYSSTIYTNGSDVSIIDNVFYELNTNINISSSNNNPGVFEVVNLTFLLKDQLGTPLANQIINIKINDIKYNITTNNKGYNTIKYTIQANETIINATYIGDEKYFTNSTLLVLYAQKLATQILVDDVKTKVGKQFTINGTLNTKDNTPIKDATIKITVNDKTNTTTTNKIGQFNMTFTLQEMGKYPITVTYLGDKIYNQSTNNKAKVTVTKTDTKLTLKVSNSTPINNTAITITATLTDTNGNKLAGQSITIKVSDKTFNVKTNNKGIATQTYTPTKVETQNITTTYKGDSMYNNSTAITNITVKKINTKIDLKVSNSTPINNTPINITVTLTDINNNKLANQEITLIINTKTVTAKTNTNGQITQTYTPTKVETQNITATYNGDSMYSNSTKTIKITIKNKIKTKTTVTPISGVIGEKLTIKATVTDTNGGKVNEGNLIFKINGITIKDNGKLTGSTNPLKVKVVNGVATATIIPDINMVNAQNITASYIGTNIYNKSNSTPATITISKRNATIEVTTNKRVAKQGQVITITAKIYDTTGGKKTTNITKYQDEYVYFKVNGITLKDVNGNMLKVKIINGTATVNYTIPLGISCVTDMQTMTPKNHTIQVGLYNKNYQNIMTKTPTFQVERSNITITITNATINNKTHKLSMKITIKDYLGNTVPGPNKLVIKVNGLTLKNGTNAQYYYTTDGILNIKNIPVPIAKNYTSIEVITQDRLAYKNQRNTTKTIKIL